MPLTQVQGGMLQGSTNTTTTIQSNGTTAITIDASQNVGIGTSSPADKLDVARNSGANSTGGLTLTNTSTSGYGSAINWNLALNSVAGINGRMYCEAASSTASFMAWQTTSGGTLAERMRIDSSGSVLVGRTSNLGTSRFVVESDSASVNPMTVSNSRSTAATEYSILFYRNGSIVGSVQTSLSATSYVTSSDYRLKENIAPMTGALDKVQALKPVIYDWKTGGSSQGFIAHELAEVCPEAVTGEKDAVNEDGSIKPQGIDTSFLVATLTAAIQEQQAMITSLTARIAALENPPVESVTNE